MTPWGYHDNNDDKNYHDLDHGDDDDGDDDDDDNGKWQDGVEIIAPGFSLSTSNYCFPGHDHHHEDDDHHENDEYFHFVIFSTPPLW